MKCKICGNKDNLKEYKVKEVMFGTHESFLYFECEQCGCLQIADIPADMSKYYPDNYYSYTASTHYAKTKLNEILRKKRDQYVVFRKGILGRYINKINPNIDPHLEILSQITITKKSLILDVGCGKGNFLLTLKRLGFNNLVGIDPFIEKDISYDNGLCIHKESILNFKEKKDIVMFHHSFEHIPEQLQTLQAVSKILEKDGCCIIRVPTVSSYAWKHYKENWVQLDAPRHFFLHSLKSMNALAEQASMYIHKVVYDSTALQFLGSEKILKGFPLHDETSYNSLFSETEIQQFKHRANELNKVGEGDACAFILRNTKWAH